MLIKLVVALIIALIGWPITAQHAANGRTKNPARVSLLRLLASTEPYDGEPVTTLGFLDRDYEGTYLYFSEEDFKHVRHENALWFEGTGCRSEAQLALNRKYVLVSGIFRSKGEGQRTFTGALTSGSLTDVFRCDFWSDPKNPRRIGG